MANESGNELVETPHETQIEVGRKIKDRLIQDFYGSNRYGELKEEMARQLKDWGKSRFNGFSNRSRADGFVFEEMALDYYYGNLSPNPENRALAEFLQTTLQNYMYRDIDYFEGNPAGVARTANRNTEIPRIKDFDFSSTLSLMPGAVKWGVSNPDALLVDIETDSVTGKKIAKIVGVLDAKVGKSMEQSQREGIKVQLTQLVHSLKPHYQEIVKALDLEGVLPEEIDIVPPEELSIKEIKPQKSEEAGFSRKITKGEIIYIPITRDGVTNIVHAMFVDTIKSKTSR